MDIGYARVSTEDQNLLLQFDALISAGCKEENIFTEKESGTKSDRAALKAALDALKEGDTLVFWKIDRLARSALDLLTISNQVKQKKCFLKSLTDGINTSTSGGALYFGMLAMFAEFERTTIIERTMSGLAAARRQGRIGGRPRKLTEEKVAEIRKLLVQGASHTHLSNMTKIPRPTLYRMFPKHLIMALAD